MPPLAAEFPNHEPILVNTIGHAFGALVFAVSLYFLLAAAHAGRRPASRLSLAAAFLAFLWNFASLAVLACREFGWPGSGALVALSTAALSLLPAVLLDLALGGRFRAIVTAGWVLGLAAAGIHAAEQFLPASASITHRAALAVTTIGFGALTLAATVGLLVLRQHASERLSTPRLAGAMALFLFAVSLIHVGSEDHTGWVIELVVHHGGIALALIVLVQDYRFLLLDSFTRVLANLMLAGAFIVACVPLVGPALAAGASPFRRGMVFVGIVLLLWLYSELRQRVQQLLTRLVFGRPGAERLAADAPTEPEYLEAAERELAGFLRAELKPVPASLHLDRLALPAAASEFPAAGREALEAAGVEAVVPVRLPGGEVRLIGLGYRTGGRRYLSEDLAAAARLAAQISERVALFRAAEMRRLVTQAELRALESQIQPHFLFNVLNTLYGLIPREAPAARNTVLNLADLLRYHLRQDRTYIALEEELRTVEAYLAIEKLRLGSRLRSRIEVDPAALRAEIPVLSLEPLVENAVKHAVAARAEGGEVAVLARVEADGAVTVRVEDNGPGFDPVAPPRVGQGVGLANVRRRLELCYGAACSGLIVQALHPAGTAVGFRVPPPGREASAA